MNIVIKEPKKNIALLSYNLIYSALGDHFSLEEFAAKMREFDLNLSFDDLRGIIKDYQDKGILREDLTGYKLS